MEKHLGLKSVERDSREGLQRSSMLKALSSRGRSGEGRRGRGAALVGESVAPLRN